MESFTKIPIFKSYSSWLAFNPTVFPVWIRFFVNFFLLENSNSDDSESNEYHDKGVKRVQRSPQTKRKQRAPVSRKGQAKIRSKPSVAFESTSSTSPTDEQTRKLAIKGKAVTVRDPKDDETFLVSVSGGEGGTLNGPRPYRLEKSSRHVAMVAICLDLNKPWTHTFLPSFDNANDRHDQERLLRSRNFCYHGNVTLHSYSLLKDETNENLYPINPKLTP